MYVVKELNISVILNKGLATVYMYTAYSNHW